jgi:hypothetical protein
MMTTAPQRTETEQRWGRRNPFPQLQQMCSLGTAVSWHDTIFSERVQNSSYEISNDPPPLSKTVIEAKKIFKPCSMVFQILQTENSSIVTNILLSASQTNF